MIPRETVEKIIDAAQITDVIGDFVTLKRRGANYVACCPFHNEKTPSFSVNPAKGIYKCFGCGKAGTAVNFVMEHEGLSYVEALKYLAAKYHIEVVEKEESAEEIARKQRSESLYLVSDFAKKFFMDSLQSPEGHAVGYNYFKSRSLTDQTIQKFCLGWAPSGRKALTEAARNAGYKEDFLVDTNLSIKYDDGRVRDKFYERVMFPIHSVTGRVIAFGGRTLLSKQEQKERGVAKYVNSSNSDIYVKSRSLYGIFFAKSEIFRRDKCILVEGYLDVLSMHQLGVTNVVASSGTALTEEQIQLIKRFTDNITIIYDGDAAGIHAALRGIGLVLKAGMNVKVVLLPDGQDPDDFAKSHTLEQVNDFINANERDFIGFKTDILLKDAGNDPLKKATLINDVADTIALIPDAVTRTMYARSTAQKFDIDESILTGRISSTRTAMLLEDKKRKKNQVSSKGGGEYAAEVAGEVAGEVAVAAAPEGIPSATEAVEPVVTDNVKIENPYLAPCERELLGFILKEGCSYLDFDRDSKYYNTDGEPQTVAGFIDSVLAEDDTVFANSSYRKVYDEYFRLYDEGLGQPLIQGRLMNSDDAEIAAVAKDLLIEKYQITVGNYEKSLTATSTKLVIFVPKAIMAYQIRILSQIIEKQKSELSTVTDMDAVTGILSRIDALNKIKRTLCNELGRV